MDKKLDKILELVDEYIKDKKENKVWKAGVDWVKYSGPEFDSKEYMAAIESLLSEWLIVGKNTQTFEQRFAQIMQKKFGVLTNSGSSANLLMVSALKSNRLKLVKDGDKFITPIVAFPTTINPLLQNNLVPVFVDVELPSLNLDLDQVEAKLKEDPSIKGIIFAHVLGNPPDMDRLMAIIKQYDLIFLEDACDALGSSYRQQSLGSFGYMSTMSFFPAHHMTIGEGGFVATDNYNANRALYSLRDWGRACWCNQISPGDVTAGTACGNRFQKWFDDVDIIYDHRYVFDEVGYNLKPLDLQAAMGLKQIDKLKHFENKRKYRWQYLNSVFLDYQQYFHMPKATKHAKVNWFAYLLTIKDDAPFTKYEFIKYLEANKIQTRSYFSGNILYHDAYKSLRKNYKDLQKEFPIAHKVTKDSFFLGCAPVITPDQLRYMEKVIRKFMGNFNE